MSTQNSVRFYFDFISPYAWLALLESESFATAHDVVWQLEPIVYAGLLNATGLVGPVETPAKRAYTFDDVARCAERGNWSLVGPPQHPFRSIEALRVLWVFRHEPSALRLAIKIADAAWGHGADITDLDVLGELVNSSGLDARDLATQITTPKTKTGLIQTTNDAIQKGVFGVPTFEFEGELFWGHDRMSHLADRFDGRIGPARKKSAALIARGASAKR